MKVTVIGSHLCPDTLYALNRLSEAKAEPIWPCGRTAPPTPTSGKTAASASPALSWRTEPPPGIWPPC